jgi:hypothetical protein
METNLDQCGHADTRCKLSAEQLEARRAKQREYQRRHRSRMTPAEVEAKRAKDRERHCAMTPAQRAERLKAQRQRHREMSAESGEKKRQRDLAWKKTPAGRASAALYKAKVRKIVTIGRIIKASNGDERPRKKHEAWPKDAEGRARTKRDLARRARAAKRELLAIGRLAYGHRRGKGVPVDGTDDLRSVSEPIAIQY